MRFDGATRTYACTFVTLLALTGLTVAAARLDVGAAHLPIALTIAGVKAALILTFFMHLRAQTRLVKLYMVGAGVWLGIMVVLTLSDFLTRGAAGFP
jgi:cytochrome c oxidase subunit IV